MAKREIVPVDWLKKNMPHGGQTCSYYMDTDAGPDEHIGDICHARALPHNQYIRCKEIVAIHSCLPKKSEDESARRYYDFLFSKERSPYREAFKGLETYKNDDGSYIGFSLHDTNVLTCLVGSLCIASRTPWEFPHKAETFNKLLDMGLKDTEAYYIAQCTDRNYDGNYKVSNANNHTTIYNFADDYYNYNQRQDYTTVSLKNMDSGHLNYERLGQYGKAVYGKMESSSKMYRMFFGDDGKVHPFRAKFADRVETYYYKGRFGILAKADPKFPIPFKPADNGDKMLSLKQIVETRDQWSAL